MAVVVVAVVVAVLAASCTPTAENLNSNSRLILAVVVVAGVVDINVAVWRSAKLTGRISPAALLSVFASLTCRVTSVRRERPTISVASEK